MSPEAALTEMPFAEHLGIDVLEAEDGRAVGKIALQPEHSSNPGGRIAHGGVTFSLADTIGAAAVMSESGTVTPTVDFRMDFLAPATDDLRAEAEVVRHGGSIAVSRVEIYAEDGENSHVATAHGTYKTDGKGTDDTPWTDGSDLLEEV